MTHTINERVGRLRSWMKENGFTAFVFPSSDPHNSEYVADHWKSREWISGFSGSAGTAVVTLEHAALWTDSRYFIAAEKELNGTGFQLMKLRMEGTPSVSEWLASELSTYEKAVVGQDGNVNSFAEVAAMEQELATKGNITVQTDADPMAELWTDRPVIPDNMVSLHPLEYSGESTSSKVSRVRKQLLDCGADGLLVTALDEIAWVLNLRGSDVHCNPVFVSYLLISPENITLYINNVKLPDDVKAYLMSEHIDVQAYESVVEGLRLYVGKSLLVDMSSTNYSLATAVSFEKVCSGVSPIASMKAVKNKVEQDGFRAAMLRDGVAVVKFLAWLKSAVEAGGQTEISLDERLTALRAEQPKFKGISFDTIVGYEAHGAIVHYEATPETDIPVQPHGLVLIDSGAQYLDGTTDITRTIALGELSEEQCRVYTLVLKGHIQLDMCRFPAGACGSQIDALARAPMWREGYNYMHGTGHGVGSYLNVHEGPHQIRMEWRPTPLQAGMTVTNEPGIYLEGKFGVRIENTLLIVPAESTAFGDFLKFETLTLAPIDTAPIVLEMLSTEEREWLNNYHRRVYERLSPYLEGNEKEWLRKATLPI
ncbi:aminopeptidase P family protein [Prevotella melaninogenica]|uniref:aminopeptidase P family protein n=1 Tax=Prevotella melaninogenica TaxID=28132 RepID=UPI001C5E2473|nr:aminopeptidase P family protein [Prevotella melaninogenica]MBW4728343.1 aminopeptidase P family protein [Prevotella melaninogenica]MBW4730973.1 aminopeptidase P family protein [Prevotella melaninogenica]MBW4749234.1 aminopeptidase P family protein [Prevotella melaninogenica]